MKAACLTLLAGVSAAAMGSNDSGDEKLSPPAGNHSKSPTSVAVPRDFGTRILGGAESVTYSESSGEEPNVIDRPTIEKMCSAYGGANGSRYTPTFDDGYDRPITFKTWRFTNKQHWGNFTKTDWYVCDKQESAASSIEAICNCNYRIIPKFRAQIKTTAAAGLQIIDLDYSKKEARRSKTQPSRPHEESAETRQAIMSQFASAIVGSDEVAGIHCVIRRRSLGGESHVDLCISDDPEKKLAPELRYRTLSEYMPRPDGKGVYRSSRTDKIVLDGVVDPGIFAIPDGFSVKDLK